MTFRHSELSCRFNYAFVFMLFISGSELCDSRQVDSVLEYLFSSAFTNTDQQCMPPPCSACQKVSHPSLSLYQSFAERANRAHNDSSLLPSRKKLGWNSQRSTPLTRKSAKNVTHRSPSSTMASRAAGARRLGTVTRETVFGGIANGAPGGRREAGEVAGGPRTLTAPRRRRRRPVASVLRAAALRGARRRHRVAARALPARQRDARRTETRRSPCPTTPVETASTRTRPGGTSSSMVPRRPTRLLLLQPGAFTTALCQV